MSGRGEVICRVRALYPYESNDPASLSFQPHAIIEVLAQLESGWWDGWSNGKRGWFPSNYVEVLRPEEEFDAQEKEPDENQLWELQQQWRFRQQQQMLLQQQQQQQILLQQQQQQQLLQQQQQQQQQLHHLQRPADQQRQRLLDQEMRHRLRMSLHASEMVTPAREIATEQQNSQDSSGWILQTTEDGSEQYYYNTRTQEMRYSIPPEMGMDEKVKQALASTNGPMDDLSSPSPSSPSSPSMNEMQDQYERPPVRPVRAANRALPEDHPYNQHAVSDLPSLLKEELEEEFHDDDTLPPNWERKVTPRGRYYYYNVKTEESTWALENIDPDTGVLMSSVPESPFPTSEPLEAEAYHLHHHHQQQQQPVADERPSSLNSNNDDIAPQEPVTWQNLSYIIAHAIHKLKDSVRQGYNQNFFQDSTIVVHGIRMMLYVTQCLDKETSVHLNQHKNLRNLHRTLLAALAKLVLSTKVASSAWPTPESLTKLESDADEVLIAVRNFMTCAQEMEIQLKDVKPTLTDEPWRANPLNSMMGKSDMVTATLVLADNVRGAMSSFSESVSETFRQQDLNVTLEALNSNAPLMVAQFRNLSNTISDFLNTVEEMSHVAPELIKCKQPIYSAMGSLFIVSQSITSSELDQDQVQIARQRLEECFHAIEAGISDVVEMAKLQQQQPLVGERDTPTPTQKQYSHTSPVTTATASLLSVDTRDEDDGQSAKELANSIRKLDMGLSAQDEAIEAAEAKGAADGTISDGASYHSDTTLAHAGRQHRDSETSSRRDTLVASPTMTNTTLSTVASPLSPTGTGDFPPIISKGSAETSWFLKTNIDPNEMMFTLDGSVKGGTLHCLVQHLTQHDQLDSAFNSTFLLTYRSFCTTQELFNELFNRYQLAAPEELTPKDLEIWKEKKLKLVRLRVFNVIKSWLETYFNEEEDRPFLPEISHFTEHVIVESMKFGAEQLMKLIKKRMLAEDSSQIRKMKLSVRAEDMPPTILPKNMKRLKLLDLDPLELARQMTIMDFKLYNKIKPVECLDKNWGKPDTDQKHIAANVRASIEHSNQVTAWVTDSILSNYGDPKKRAYVVRHWVWVAERCRQLQNYNTCMAILSAFDNGSIGRLKRTWALLSARHMQVLQSIRRLMGSNRNFSEYRNMIHNINPPCIPFLGIYLQDLTFIEDGNSNFLKNSKNLINFAKRMKTAEVIRELQQHQSTHYMLTAVPDIQEFIKTHLHSSREEEELYKISLQAEPREKDEDTIARRLKESGFV